MENRRYRSMGGWGKASAILLHLLPYLLKNNLVNPVNPV
jgi:hypothetical protein